MSDLPPDHPEAAPGDPARTLNDILAALSQVGDDAADEGGPSGHPMQDAVGELSAALDQLFALVRSERAEQRARITELEAALSAAHARIRQLEAGEQLDDIPAPPPNDFGQLREAAERLRLRTEELFREAGPAGAAHAAHRDDTAPVDVIKTVASAVGDTPGDTAAEERVADDVVDGIAAVEDAGADDLSDVEEAAEARMRAARDAVESSIADEHPAAHHDEPQEFGKPAVLQAFPGAAGPGASGIDVESDLEVDDIHDDLAVEAAAVLPVPAPPEPEAPTQSEPSDAPSDTAPGEPADSETKQGDEPPAPSRRPSDERAEPVEIAPRPARKRRAGLRRRRIDARKLATVDPATALRAMVSSIDDIWTAGVSLDLVIALTDGGSLKVSGGHNKPLAVVAVKSGTPARTTVTATTAQLVPLFGRLELTDAQSAPLIHGPRRDADLLVGWIDRAQRLEPQPL